MNQYESSLYETFRNIVSELTNLIGSVFRRQRSHPNEFWEETRRILVRVRSEINQRFTSLIDQDLENPDLVIESNQYWNLISDLIEVIERHTSQ
ncbi:hypothetical protein [Soymovirus malvae]|nr:hypothetical protein [Malva associated soymovirus 1]